MDFLSRNHFLLYVIMGVYLGCSKPVFDKVYDTIKVVIDEMFHIPQAQAYCDGKFDVWDPKITTLPGLYFAVVLFLSPFVPCTVYNLRFFNLIVSGINMGLFYVILNIVYGYSCGRLNLTLQALNMILLPPLYFFAHVFYTDMLALMFLLLLTISAIKRNLTFIVFFALCSIGCRQTNVIWVNMFFAQKLSETVLKASRVYGNDGIQLRKHQKGNTSMSHVIDQSALKRCYDVEDVYHAMTMPYDRLVKSFFHNSELKMDMLCTVALSLPMVLFVVFICYNGSIVVGDKQAHTLTVNMPQLFYFLLFYGFFGLPIVLATFQSTLRYMMKNKYTVLEVLIFAALAVHFNTVTHPYLLADNRHYTFYVWNRWFGKYPEAVYLMLPVYVFLACSFISNLEAQNCVSFLSSYYPCLVLAICFQRLLEVRYFIVPYVIARLRFPKAPTWLVVCEFLWYLAINVATFSVFFSKEVKWSEFDEPQRIIW